jgi:hypothetical protein
MEEQSGGVEEMSGGARLSHEVNLASGQGGEVIKTSGQEE